MIQTFRVELVVTVEPETDTEHFQPGLFCATLAGTNWKWVGDSPEAAARHLLDWALSGGYKDQDWPKERPYALVSDQQVAQ